MWNSINQYKIHKGKSRGWCLTPGVSKMGLIQRKYLILYSYFFFISTHSKIHFLCMFYNIHNSMVVHNLYKCTYNGGGLIFFTCDIRRLLIKPTHFSTIKLTVTPG